MDIGESHRIIGPWPKMADSVGHTDVKKKSSNRTVIVFISLFFTLTVTSALLLALAPAPLAPTMFTSLFAVDSPSSLDVIFNTQAPLARWKYIYIHHSQTPDGNAASLARDHVLEDHFVLGNGDGCVDGEIQITQRWNNQNAVTTPPPGVGRIDPACLSICLIGDFDQTRPTVTQQHRLVQLVTALQSRLGIPADRVYTFNLPPSPAGIGRLFPVDSLHAAILR
jgi:hypothetical protein